MKKLLLFVVTSAAMVLAADDPRVFAQYYQLRSAWSDKCLDIDWSYGDINGANAQQWDCSSEGRINQLWELKPLSGDAIK